MLRAAYVGWSWIPLDELKRQRYDEVLGLAMAHSRPPTSAVP